MNDKKENLGKGTPVKTKVTNGFGGILLATIPVIILFTVFLGSVGFMIGIVISLVFAIPIGLSTLANNSAIKGTCPYCNANVSYNISFDGMKCECPVCKKTFGYYKMNFYKIDDENKSYFQTESERTNDLLEKQLKDSSIPNKSNIEQIKELKELLDMNAITQEEFDKKKKELLDRS